MVEATPATHTPQLQQVKKHKNQFRVATKSDTEKQDDVYRPQLEHLPINVHLSGEEEVQHHRGSCLSIVVLRKKIRRTLLTNKPVRERQRVVVEEREPNDAHPSFFPSTKVAFTNQSTPAFKRGSLFRYSCEFDDLGPSNVPARYSSLRFFMSSPRAVLT